MLSEYFVQFGLIIFPITAYQLWIFGVSYKSATLNTLIMGLYGGLSAILCQIMPVYIVGQPENFQCVPIIISILYGKRKAGILSIGILSLYQIITLPNEFIVPILGILIYSAIPMLMCKKFDQFGRRKRFLVAQIISLCTIVLELIFIIILFLSAFGDNGWNKLFHYLDYLSIATIIQLLIMTVAFFLLEKVIEDGRMYKRHQSLIKYNSVGICSFDDQNRFTSVNPAYERITGYVEAELLGKSGLLLWPDDRQDFAQKVLNDFLMGDIKSNVDVELQHKDGHKINVLATVIPMVEHDKFVGYFAMVTDITEVKMAEEFMRNSEKLSAIGELAAGIAHEIRNPLTSIKGFIQLLFGSANSVKDKNFYNIIMSEFSRIEGIVSEMLVLAKPSANTFRPFYIKEKLEEVEYLLKSEANMCNVDLDIHYGKANPRILGDGNQMKQVFLNVGKNAIEAMPRGGKLLVNLALECNQVIIKFIDNGQGIPSEILNNIGKPFFTTKEKGTGLGFLICQRIVAKHNGSLNIQSIADSGTTVTVILPAFVENQNSAQPAS
jgi:PAS domain S-box-containing protein